MKSISVKTTSALAAALCCGALAVSASAHLSQNSPSAKLMTIMKRGDSDMAQAPMNGKVDHDFATMMAAHHVSAIDMAKVEIQYGRDKTLKEMARKMMAAQTKERKQLLQLAAKHK